MPNPVPETRPRHNEIPPASSNRREAGEFPASGASSAAAQPAFGNPG